MKKEASVQRRSTATSPASTDFIRPTQACDLHERPTSTSLPLVHTERIAWERPRLEAWHALNTVSAMLATKRGLSRRFPRQSLVWRAGFALIVAGIVCLYLSDAVVSGWWQGTLDAFGVGFIVGGIVDVLAISGLTQAVTADRERQEADRDAQLMLDKLRIQVQGVVEEPSESWIEARRKMLAEARDLLERRGAQMDPLWSDTLWDYIKLDRNW
jgi:hypothetical protein